MNWRIGKLLVIPVAALLGSALAAEPDLLAKLEESLKAVSAFEYGKDAGPLRLVEQIVVVSGRNPQQRQFVEQRLLESLSAKPTRDAREFLCRQLFTIGSARCVPVLEPWLSDPDSAHMARYVLGRLEDPEAGAALLRALDKTAGKLQAGLLNTLGRRAYAPALPRIVRLLGSPDAVVAGAAASALGGLGGAEAVEALTQARPNATQTVQGRIDHALLTCADQFLKSGQERQAIRIYERFSAPNREKHLRVAALRGLVATGDQAGLRLLVKTIQDPDADLRAIAIGFARTARAPAATKMFADLLPSLPPEAQELMLGALGARGDAAASPAVAAAAKSEHERVRAAAYEALGQIGGAAAVELLAQAAAAAGGREQQIARLSLVRLAGDEVNPALVRLLRAGEPRLQVECARALAGRRATTALEELLKLARGPEASVRQAALGALGALAGESDLRALTDLLVRPKEANDRPALEQAVETVFRRVPGPEGQAGPVLAALASAPVDAKPALLRLLGKAATPAALQSVTAALAEQSPAVRDAALRTLADWPSAAPAEQLLTAAGTATDLTSKTLALRGYVRMAGLAKDPMGMYARAMELAQRPEDKKLVLAGLGAAGAAGALKLAEQYLRDEQLQAEAALATVQIADRLRQADAARARAAVQNVLAIVHNPAIRPKAQEVLNQMEQYEGYILTWLSAGPYKEKGKESRAVFDAVLAPEQPDAGEVAWKSLTKGIGSWDVNLEAEYGAQNHCAAFVRAQVWSPQEQDARLELGSDDAVKAWLNHKLAHANYASRGLSPRQDLVNVKLRQGWNDLVLKVVNHEGGWAFCCRVRRPDGRALEGLKTEAK
jgi:HEAT repeat protein